jgi:hypothetical protein
MTDRVIQQTLKVTKKQFFWINLLGRDCLKMLLAVKEKLKT